MQVVYAKQEPPKSWSHSIFLAGPTPRDPETPSWRPRALQILESLGYDGVVFVPEQDDGKWRGSYIDQVKWEQMGLNMADRIVFWVDRDLRTMPAFTTNVEYGQYVESGKAILGHPDGAAKTSYLDWLAGENDVRVFDTLPHTLAEAISDRVTFAELEPRSGGERYVPIDVWATPMFQAWYRSLKAAGNRLDEARVLWTTRVPKSTDLFSYAIWVKVWIAAEGRHKDNEWVFSRRDLACVVLYQRPEGHSTEADRYLNTEVVLIKEFRSPGRTPDGFVHELPGGSVDPGDSENAKTAALREVHEETGLVIAKDRLRYVGSRQPVGSLSSHHVHCYAAELTDPEMIQVRHLTSEELTFSEAETVQSYVKITTVADLLRKEDADWATVGLVMRALTNTR